MFYFHKYSCSHSHTDPTSTHGQQVDRQVRHPQEAPAKANEGRRNTESPVHVLPWPEAPEPPVGVPSLWYDPQPAATWPPGPLRRPDSEGARRVE